MFVMQTSAMKTCFQIAECSFSFAKLSNISVTSKYLAGYFVLFIIKALFIARYFKAFALTGRQFCVRNYPRAMPWGRSFWAFSPYLNHM